MSGSSATRHIDELTAAFTADDRTRYYEVIARSGDPYGTLALGVVKQSLISGRVAKNLALEVGRRAGIFIDQAMWLEISEGLMAADFAIRQRQPDAIRPLPWVDIRNYHVGVFAAVRLPPEAWTAFIPLHVVGDAGAPHVWADMCSRDVVSVGCETIASILTPLADQVGMPGAIWNDVVPALRLSPPIIGSNAHPGIAACMDTIRALDACNAGLTTTQNHALFWIDVMATDPYGMMRDLAIAPTAAWRSATAGLF